MVKKSLCIILLAALALFAFAEADPPEPSARASAAAALAQLPPGLSAGDAEVYRLGFAAGFDAALLADPDQHDYILNTNSMKFHWPGCEAVGKMKASNRADFHGTRDQVISLGYAPCKICQP